MEHEAVVLRSELSKMGRGRGNRFPAELRERVIVYGRRRRADGASWTRIGIELGMKWETVRRWCIEKQPAQLRRVEIVAEANEATNGISVVSPSGFRAEGLTVRDAALMLATLR
jgi:hypothetical protein